LRGEFEGWSEPDRDELVKKLLPIIADADFPGIVIGIHLDEFKKALSGRTDLPSLFGTPYGACFQWVVQSLMYLQIRARNSERIAFIHERNDFQAEALDAFNFVKEYSNPQRAAIGIAFGDKQTYTPLQAADILAYEGNKRMRNPNKPERRPWKILNPDRRILAAHYGRNNMHDLIERLEKVRDGRIDEINQPGGWRGYLLGTLQASSARPL